MNSIKQGSAHTINLVTKISRHAQSSAHKSKLNTTQPSMLPGKQNSRGGNYNLVALVSLIKRLISQVGKENQKENMPQPEANIFNKRAEGQPRNIWENSQTPKRNNDNFYTRKDKKEGNNQE